MPDTLVIVESPAKAKTINKYLGPGYKVAASVGHIKDLPKNRMGVDVEDGFKPEYVTIQGKGKILQKIRKLAKESDRVLLAPDPDREGEAIAWHIADEIRRYNKEIQRILIHEITERGVGEAISHPLPLNRRRFESQQARRILDRLVGYQISPLLWDKVRRGLSAGRVQSVAVRLIVDREREIQAFVPEEYWLVDAVLRTRAGETLTARLAKKGGRKIKPSNEEEVTRILSELEGATWRVGSVEAKRVKKNPPPPFTTAKLQQEAARLLRFTAKRTMGLAQSLYQGVELGSEGPVGLITYMRTDSTRVSEDALRMVRAAIGERFGKEYLPAKARRFKTRKGAQDAHEAIRPTSIERTPESVARYLDRDQLKLYRLIYNRFVASQMAAAQYDRTQVVVEANGYEFKASGQVMVFPGYTRIYKEGQSDDDRSSTRPPDQAKGTLPRVEQGEELGLEKIDTRQEFTQPPPRFTEASLVKELEERGIGRPSTYAAIISNIQDRGYVEKAEGRFRPTELGTLVTDLLVEAFPEILDVEFTAQMESKLDLIEEGQADWQQILREFYEPFARTLEKARESMRDVKREEIPTDIVCDKCGARMVIRWGRNGSFLACSAYPDCKNTKEYERDEQGNIRIKEPETTGEVCPNCGRPMIIKNGRFGRFLACSGYPECKTTKPISVGVACPRGCGGELIERKSRKGRVFYSCSKYPDCDYAIWDRPIPEKCPQCGHPFLVVKEARRGRNPRDERVVCPACGYTKE